MGWGSQSFYDEIEAKKRKKPTEDDSPSEAVSYADLCPNYMIVYEDDEIKPEYFTEKGAALERLEQASDRWNCHLFERIKSV